MECKGYSELTPAFSCLYRNDNDGDGRADQHPREDVNIIPDRADDRADHPMEDLHLVLPQDRAPM